MTDRPTIPAPGVYPAMNPQEYHDDPCPEASLSSTVAKVLLSQSPRHAWEISPRLNPSHEREEKPAFDVGSAAHAMLTGVDRGGIIVIEADDWRSKAAKEERDAAYAAGKTPLLREQHERTAAMVREARVNLRKMDCGDVFEAGRCEQPYFAQIDRVWCRALADSIIKPGEALDVPKKGVIYDYKTTAISANPDGIDRVIANLGYEVQAAHYVDTVQAVEGGDWLFRLVVQEKRAPHGLTVVQLHPEFLEIGRRKIARAREVWRRCLDDGNWPIYPAAVVEVMPPVYHARDWYEREVREDEYRQQTGRDALEAGIRWQAPVTP